jgi:3-methylfumaryl-CoA hydratase
VWDGGSVTTLAEHVAGWAPGPTQAAGRLDPWPVAAFAGVLDQPPPGPELPPLWHWFHLLGHPAQAELGEDGHPARGHFLPPIPHRRRMIAGGRLEVRAPLWVGGGVVRRSELVRVEPKSGRSGEMLFVTVRHAFHPDAAAEPAVVEEQDVVYRSQAPGAERALAPAPRVDGEQAAPWRLDLHPDAAMLFRFSALTYNTHRIHYDLPYVTEVEGYPGLVVHGPLLALLLLELPRRFASERAVTAFTYRLRAPAFAGTPVLAWGGPGGELSAGVPGQPASITGTVRTG